MIRWVKPNSFLLATWLDESPMVGKLTLLQKLKYDPCRLFQNIFKTYSQGYKYV